MTTATPALESVRIIAHRTFGYSSLTPGQEAAIAAVMEQRDTLCVLPTGSGKSAIYQLAGLVGTALTIVVSPLISLQHDQVTALNGVVPGAAVELNSTLSATEREAALARMQEPGAIFCYMAPEQLANDEIARAVAACNPALLVVDEAHCISEWGQDFRPDYLRLGAIVEALGRPTVLALTATASAPVRSEIVERLRLRDPATIVQGFDRPNIHLAVEIFRDDDEKREALVRRVVERDQPGIVYAATRRDTETIAAALVDHGIPAAAYHAGLCAAAREEAQEAFMADRLQVIAATTAFGMGIDKPNVRFVYHHDVSESIDAYYQEIGRAGRDADPAEAILFYNPEDLGLRRFQSGAGQLEVDEVQPIVDALARKRKPVETQRLRDTFDLSDTILTRVLNRLEDVDAITLHASGTVELTDRERAPEDIAEDAVEEQHHRQHYAHSKLEMLRQYAESSRCRRAAILEYFGEPYIPPCGHCDVCDRGDGAVEGSDSPFAASARVHHASLGDGTVISAEGDSLTILFDRGGYRTLSLELVLGESLLDVIQGETGDASRPA